MQDATLNEATFTSEYHQALTYITKNLTVILGNLQKVLSKDGDVTTINTDEPLPAKVQMMVKKKM